MKRGAAIVATALAVALSTPALASADPIAPQADTPCASNFAEAMTWPTDAKVPLECVNGQWQTVASPYPVSDRWLTYGPEMKLHGEGLRNPSIRSGDWTASPQDPNTECRAEQLAVVPGTPTVGPPRIDETATGEPLSFQVVPRLFSIEMSGYCLWTRVGP